MRLIDLEPRWYASRAGDGPRLQRSGITFRCPHCPDSGQRLGVAVHLDGTNMDPDSETPQQWGVGECVWKVEAGSDFRDLSLSPSIDASPNHWHGHITNGEIVGGFS